MTTTILDFTQPKLDIVRDGEYILTQDYTVQWKLNEETFAIVVPKGFNTDIASVPQAVWSLGITPDGLHRGAAIIHDYMYFRQGKVGDNQDYYKLDKSPNGVYVPLLAKFRRSECDKLFKLLMLKAGVSPFKANLMYWAVRLFGGQGWKNAG